MEVDDSDLDQNMIETLKSSTPPLRMSQDHQDTNIFDNHRRLVDWVLANDGYLHRHAQIAFSSRKGFHAVVADGQELKIGTRISSCPMQVTLSVLNVLDITPFSSHGSRFPESFLRDQANYPECLQAFFLMEQLVLGDKSWWSPYLATLPTVEDVTELQFEAEADVAWLEGTNLKAGLSAQVAKWKEMYLLGMGQLKRLEWRNAVNGAYTWPRFRWAASIFGSRSFTSQVLDDTLPADQARLGHCPDTDSAVDLVKLFSHRFGVLLPLLDLLNHKPGAKVEWQARYSFIGLQILEPYGAGQELFNNYGPRDNEGLLLAYGFTIPENPFDHLVISIKPPPGSPLEATRTWKPDLRSDPERRCFIFNPQHPRSTAATVLETSLFSFDLLESISVLCANERELQTMFTRKETLMSYSLGEQNTFEDNRIVLATLSQLLRECSVRASRLRGTDPSNLSPPITPASLKQANARIYRDSQLSIVETAVAVCQFILRSAMCEEPSPIILARLRVEHPGPVFESVEQLVRRHGRLVLPSELLTPAAMLEMLTAELSTPLQKCLAALETHLRTTEEADGARDFSKSLFAVILAALYGDNGHGIKLPRRITARLKQLAEWYSPGSEAWAYVPTPGPWAPGEEPPPGLIKLLAAAAAMSSSMPTEFYVKRWLRPERVCWGWNVMEEEIVRVPTSILNPTASSSGAGQEQDSILIYWPRC